MDIGKIIFFDNITGEIITTTSEYKDAKIKKTISQIIASYNELKDRNRESFDFIELQYGEFKQEFQNASTVKIDVNTKKILFTYTTSSGNVTTDKTLMQQIEELKKAQAKAQTEMFEMLLNLQLSGGV